MKLIRHLNYRSPLLFIYRRSLKVLEPPWLIFSDSSLLFLLLLTSIWVSYWTVHDSNRFYSEVKRIWNSNVLVGPHFLSRSNVRSYQLHIANHRSVSAQIALLSLRLPHFERFSGLSRSLLPWQSFLPIFYDIADSLYEFVIQKTINILRGIFSTLQQSQMHRSSTAK